jgi:putative tricarboxylic transport membrane protein
MIGQRGSEALLLVVVAGFAVWLAQDAARRSPSFENLVLVVPVAILLVGLSAALAVAALRRPAEPGAGGVLKVMALLALLVGLVAGLDTIGFDVSSFLFLVAATWLLGERNPVRILLFSAITTAAVVLSLEYMLPFEMNNLLLDVR